MGISRSGGGFISRFGRPSAFRLSLRMGGKAPDVRRTGCTNPWLLGFGAAGGGIATGAATGIGLGGCGGYC
jgi:hypothetical protein